jgi:hypothetical protein
LIAVGMMWEWRVAVTGPWAAPPAPPIASLRTSALEKELEHRAFKATEKVSVQRRTGRMCDTLYV